MAEEEKAILVHLASEKDEIGETFNVWYVLKHGGGGSPKLSKLYDDAPPQFKCFTPGSNSAMVGSCLYVITGQAWMQSPSRLHWIDTLKPEDGWKSSKDLPFYVKGGKLLVTGNLICVLPVNSKLIPTPDSKRRYLLWGYIYDTVKQEGYAVKRLRGDYQWSPCPIWALCEERQAILTRLLGDNRVNLYDLGSNSWKRYRLDLPIPQGGSCTVSDGVLYTLELDWNIMNSSFLPNSGCRCWDLHAYHLLDGHHQVIKLPLDGFKGCQEGVPILVPLGDSKICFLWYHQDKLGSLHYATFKISLSFTTATLLEQGRFRGIYAMKLVNCMPFDSYREDTAITGEEETELKQMFEQENLPLPKESRQGLAQKMQTKLAPNMNLLRSGFSSLASPAPAAAAANTSILTKTSASFPSEYYKCPLERGGTGIVEKLINREMMKEELPTSATEDKPILIHVSSANSDDGWYIFSPSAANNNGPKLFRVFQDRPNGVHFTRGTKSVVVGSFLYVITGKQPDGGAPSSILRLDTQKPAKGWKLSSDLPFAFDRGTVHAVGSLIYMFPEVSPFQGRDCEPLWGYVYDTVKRKGHPINPPSPELSETFTPIWAVSEEKQSIMSPGGLDARYVDLYNKKKKSWSREFGHIRLPQLMVPGPYTVSNGVLYLLDLISLVRNDGRLYAYDIRQDGFPTKIELPLFGFTELMEEGEMSEDRALAIKDSVFLVAMGDSKICVLWYERDDKGGCAAANLHYATLGISLDTKPSPTATFLEHKYFENIDAVDLCGCMPCDSFKAENMEPKDDGQCYKLCEPPPPPNFDPLMEPKGHYLELLDRKRNYRETQKRRRLFLGTRIFPPQPREEFPGFGGRFVGFSSHAAAAPLTPSAVVSSNKPPPPSLFSESKGYLARGAHLLKKCIKK